jgi:hypothetical protein
MTVLLTAAGCYIYYTVDQLLQSDQPSLSDLSILIFKVLCLINTPAYPILLGPIALKQQQHLCHPGMSLSLTTFVIVLSTTAIFNLGLAGIHFKSHIGHWNSLLLIVPSIFITFITTIAVNLILFTWLNDFLVTSPDWEKQELITAKESDAALEKYECLKSAISPLFFVLFPFIQLLLVFSLYNTLLGNICVTNIYPTVKYSSFQLSDFYWQVPSAGTQQHNVHSYTARNTFLLFKSYRSFLQMMKALWYIHMMYYLEAEF